MHVVVERRAEAVAGEMPPSLGREALGVSAAAVTPEAVIRVRSISVLGRTCMHGLVIEEPGRTGVGQRQHRGRDREHDPGKIN